MPITYYYLLFIKKLRRIPEFLDGEYNKGMLPKCHRILQILLIATNQIYIRKS